MDVDVVVLGLGPGGESLATQLAKGGLQVVGVDRRLVGGECPYYGCIPSKMMIRAADALAEARRIDGLAGDATVRPDWSPVAARIRDEATTDWDDRVAVDRLEEAGVEFVRGHGRLTAPGVVQVDDQTYVAACGVVLNTGTEPAVPSIAGLEDTPFWTNREAVRVTDLPTSLIVIGGGAIGVELAQAFSRFGVQVTIVEAAPRVLAPEEPEASALVTRLLESEGIRVIVGAEIQQVGHDGAFTVTVGGEELRSEQLLLATGRRNNLADVGLDTVGLDPAAKVLDVDEWMRAGERLWGIGDITGKGAFTHVSMYQADVAARDILGQGGSPADHRAVSRVTFSDPEVGSVGLTEQAARDRGGDIRTGLSEDFGARGWIAKADGLVKLVADGELLVGATSVGPSGGEVLSMLAAAVHAKIPVETLKTMHFAYPTFHRAVMTALADL
ncbi:NAD(P)/FAD-dependent oxidoreductase [Nocardioides sp. JQ2195]|uniref:dihydrolipoyl dehydrogenase family protein n=1 Tax=Nocardioides sp. JQ2195 TaxID=2592334 RepID=UPI00143EC704|nr:NAD(P)/FAD-dependent oxidoreductase [Nocardioides sp. JQ2195]QIX26884.1 NAD(P)/FAD-dependent oxidoreductase [Nocardioides sp. JQ2195]